MGNVTIQPTSRIIARLGLEPNGTTQKFFTQSCYKRMDKYVPMRDGDLRTIVDIEPQWITYEVPYAHPQYIGFTSGPVRHYTTPGTGPYWDKRMMSAEKQDLIKEVENFIKKGN